MTDKRIRHITCEHLREIREKGGTDHVIVDLRSPLEFDAGHIDGSFNVPRRELASNIDNVVPDKGHKVVVLVGPILESEMEAIHDDLMGMGYGEVEFLAGGFDRWCVISMPSVDDAIFEMTPEEASGRQAEDDKDAYEGDDPEEENEPLY